MELGWSHGNPVEIQFGSGKYRELGRLVTAARVVLVTTPGTTRRGITGEIRSQFGKRLVEIYDRVSPNPEISEIEQLREQLRGSGITGVVGVGGGSAMDTAKSLSFLLGTGAEGLDLAELLETKRELPPIEPLDMTAVPTTHGTGGEVTPFATLWDGEKKKKYSLSGDLIFPNRAVVDPELTTSLPESVSISTALDALSQGFEALWNRNRTPLTGLFSVAAIDLIFTALPRVLADDRQLKIREELLRASLFSGLAISQTRTALAHSISYPLTAHLGIPHGLACSVTLPALWKFNRPATPEWFDELAGRLGFESCPAVVEALFELFEQVKLRRRVRCYLKEKGMLLKLVDEMYTPERAGNNLRGVERADLVKIIAETDKWLWG